MATKVCATSRPARELSLGHIGTKIRVINSESGERYEGVVKNFTSEYEYTHMPFNRVSVADEFTIYFENGTWIGFTDRDIIQEIHGD